MAGKPRIADAGITDDISRTLDTVPTAATPRAAAAWLDGVIISNINATTIHYVKIYNKATAATQSDTPILTIAVAAKTTVAIMFPRPVLFSAGISIRAAAEAADSGTTAPTAGDVVTHLYSRLAS